MHAATLSTDSYQRIAATGGSVSVSTESEQSAGQGYPPTWQVRQYDIPVSLSMDTSVWWSGDLFSAMRTTLGADRSREHLEAHAKGDTVTALHLRAEQVVDWATRGGARALGRDDLGRLEPGAKADVVLIKNDDSPVSFPLLNPYGHVAFQAQRGDVHTVLVDGRVVKATSTAGRRRPAGAYAATSRRPSSTCGGASARSVWHSGHAPRAARGRRGARQPVPVHRLPVRDHPRRPRLRCSATPGSGRRSGSRDDGRTWLGTGLRRGAGPRARRAARASTPTTGAMTLSEVATAAGPGPADRPAAAADPGGARLRPLGRRQLRS